MLDVVIVSNYWHFPNEKSSSRYHSIASLATSEKMLIEVVTSRFYHTKKQYRENMVDITADISYKATLIKERGYKKNISILRIISHKQFAEGVINYLSLRKKPDAIYLFVPPTGLAKKVVEYAKRNNIRIIIDILDLWPEAFQMVLPNFVAKTLLASMKKSVEYVYRNADEVIAVSNTYVNRALKHNTRKNIGHSVFIGTDIAVFDKVSYDAPTLKDKLRPVTMAYIGMLGHSYDLCRVMDAMGLLIQRGYDEVELLVMGDGPLKEKFQNYALQHNLPVRFTGRLSYEDMSKKLVKCDIGLNVLVGNAAQSIINKQADYVSAGIPIINVQKNQEFSELLKEYDAGLSCRPGDTDSLADAIYMLAINKETRQMMGKNSRRLAEEKFDRKKTYHEIINVIKGDCK